MFCKFETIGENHHKCSICGFEIKIKREPTLIRKHCGATTSLIGKVANFTGAMVQWVGAGAPVVNQEQKNNRLEICKSCDHYDSGTCKLCSCNLGFKTMLETAACPIGKW
jgi:hypothetical protein